MTTRRIATCCAVGLSLGNAEANRKQEPRVEGMRPSANEAGRRHNGNTLDQLSVKEAEE
jgi:hypothetical protein